MSHRHSVGQDPTRPAALKEDLDSRGFAILPECLPDDIVRQFIQLTDVARAADASDAAVSNSSGVFALRNLVDVVPETKGLLQCPAVREVIEAVLGKNAFLIRSTLFDKTNGANWGVFWHQDLSIAVQERFDLPGFHSWTRKAGVQCVQPPLELMQQILTIRLHLDPCFAENGALRVLSGTHRTERFSPDRIDHLAMTTESTTCEVPAGGAVLMRPLLLHASSPMEAPGHRRVIHLELAAFELPSPLQWRYRISVAPS